MEYDTVANTLCCARRVTKYLTASGRFLGLLCPRRSFLGSQRQISARIDPAETLKNKVQPIKGRA